MPHRVLRYQPLRDVNRFCSVFSPIATATYPYEFTSVHKVWFVHRFHRGEWETHRARSRLRGYTAAQKRMKELPFVIRSLGKRCCTTAICYPPFSDEPTCSLFKPPHMVVVHTMIPCQSILDHQHAPIEGNMHDWSRLTGARRTRARRRTEVSCCSCRRGMRQTTPIRPSPTAC